MAGIAMNHSFGNSPKQLVNHDCFVILGDRIKCLLHNMTAKRIHGEIQSVAAYGLGNFNDLVRSAMLKTTLNEKISKSINHKRVCLGNNGFDDFEFLLRCAHFELLLQENGSLLVVIADNLVNDVLLVAVDVAIE